MGDRSRNLALLLLRLAGLYLALAHGWGKVAALAAGKTGFIEGVGRLGFPAPVLFAWAAALAELAGILLAVGLFTRPVAIAGAGTMAVAAFLSHRAHLQWLAAVGLASPSPETLKGWGSPEMATLYLLVFLALALLGPGAWSLDARLRRRR